MSLVFIYIYIYMYIYIYIYIWATVNIWYVDLSHQFFGRVLSFSKFWKIHMCISYLYHCVLMVPSRERAFNGNTINFHPLELELSLLLSVVPLLLLGLIFCNAFFRFSLCFLFSLVCFLRSIRLWMSMLPNFASAPSGSKAACFSILFDRMLHSCRFVSHSFPRCLCPESVSGLWGGIVRRDQLQARCQVYCSLHMIKDSDTKTPCTLCSWNGRQQLQIASSKR